MSAILYIAAAIVAVSLAILLYIGLDSNVGHR